MMLISFSVKADELVESQSLAQAISELASAIKEHTLDEQTSRKQSVPASRRLQTFPVAPLSDSQKNKPQHQFVTVLKSTIPEIPEGSVFKSNTHGITFFFNGYWLALGAVTDYFPNDFGEIMENDSYQWTLSNFIEGITPYTGGSSRNDRRTNFRTYSGTTIEVWETDCMSERSLQTSQWFTLCD